MKVYAKHLISDFIQAHAGSKKNLEAWLAEAEDADWKTTADVRDRYKTASFLADNHVVFNVSGNNYRLLVQISFKSQVVVIIRVGTHAEYDKWNL